LSSSFLLSQLRPASNTCQPIDSNANLPALRSGNKAAAFCQAMQVRLSQLHPIHLAIRIRQRQRQALRNPFFNQNSLHRSSQDSTTSTRSGVDRLGSGGRGLHAHPFWRVTGVHLDQALTRILYCAQDALREHHPYRDGLTLHGAAVMRFVPAQTSSNEANKYS